MPGQAAASQVPYDPFAPVGSAPAAAPVGDTVLADDEVSTSHKPRTGRIVALVAGTALLAGLIGGGVGAAVTSAHDSDTSTANTSLNTGLNTGNTPAVLPTGSVEAVAKKLLPSVVSIVEKDSSGGGEGSGVVISADGLILTNNHVVEGAAAGGTLSVNLPDNRTVDATIVGRDPSSDLAVIKAKGVTDLDPATLGSSSSLVVGQTVVAVGSPLGLSGTVTSGIVSALDRPVRTSSESGQAGQGSVLSAIQTDAAINPGNSGGPLVDLDGKVVGINSAIATLGQSTSGTQSGSIGLGFSIPIDQARVIAQELIKTGKATHAQLGVNVGDATNGGALLSGVTAGGPAAKAGLKVGDTVMKVGNRYIDSADALVAAVRSYPPGSQVTLTYVRGGQTATATVTLGTASGG